MRPSRRKWAAVKPPTAAINWSHPLAQGLVNGVLLTHESVGTIRTLQGEGMTLSAGSLAAEWNLTAGGWVWRDPGGRVFTLTSSLSQLPLDYPFTVVARTAARAGNNGTIRRCVSFATAAGATAFGVGWSGTTGAALGMGASTAEASTVVGLDVMVSLGYVGESITARHLSVNGVRKVTDTTSRAVVTPAQLRVSDSTGACFYDLAYGLIYTRALTPSELQWLAVEPYAFCVAPRRQFAVRSPAPPPIALLDSGSGGSTTGTTAATCTLDTTGANLIVVAGGDYDPGVTGSSTLTDLHTNTWTPRTLYVEGGTQQQVRLYYCTPPPAKTGVGHTFSTYAGGGAFYGSVAAAAFANVHAVPFDGENGTESTGVTTLSTGPVTPTEHGELIVAAVSTAGAAISAITAGLTIIEQVANVAGQHLPLALAYLVQPPGTGAGTPITPQWTFAVTANASTTIATFKAAAAGTAPPPAVTPSADLALLGVG